MTALTARLPVASKTHIYPTRNLTNLMKALLCKKYGMPEDLAFEETATPTVGADEVLIAVEACGVNFPDALIIQGKYQMKPPFPFSPGAEVAGIVEQVGEAVSHLAVGDRVVAATGWGGMSEKVKAKASDVFVRPGSLPAIEGAAMLVTYGTVYHALKDRANLRHGETLLVLGAAGGIGMAAIELGKAMGATVIAAASTEEKLQACQQKGAHHLINYQTGNLKELAKALTGGKGVDVVLDPVGGQMSESAFRALGWKGRHLVVGFAAGDIPSLPLNLPLLKGASIEGVFWSAFRQKEPEKHRENTQELLAMHANGLLRPTVQTKFALKDGGKAIRQLLDRKALGKTVVVL